MMGWLREIVFGLVLIAVSVLLAVLIAKQYMVVFGAF